MKVDSRYIEAPESFKLNYDTENERYIIDDDNKSIFLAGGITGCPDWQKEMAERLSDAPLTILNPRRKNFPIDDPTAAFGQIAWEHNALKVADFILFWFCKATLCPIVLYELGAWSMTHKPIFIGIEPGYKREYDVRIQTRLAKPHTPIVNNLDDLELLIKGSI